MARIGLVAGYGKLPVIFSKIAKAKGDTVIAFGLKGATGEELAQYVDKMHWLNWGEFQKAIFLLATERINKIIMLGKIQKDLLFKNDLALDEKAKNVLDKLKDRKDYSILNEVGKVLGKFGIEVIDSTTYLKDLIPEKGVLTRRAPSAEETENISYGMEIARELARFDIGQTVIVKDKTVIALEAVEGTDNTILRAGDLTKGGFIVVKTARPNQDMRFDVPLIGLDTINKVVETGGKVLALESGRTLLIDKAEMIKLADENGVAIVIV